MRHKLAVVGVVLVVLVRLVTDISSAQAGVEQTTELFDTLIRVEKRFRDHQKGSGEMSEQLKNAEERETEARSRARTARLSGDRRAYEEAMVDATNAIVDQIIIRERFLNSALEILELNRRDLQRILPRLGSKGGGTGSPDQDRAHEKQILDSFRNLGHDIRNLAEFYQRLLGANPDSHSQYKLATMVGGLTVLQQHIEAARRLADGGQGGLGHAVVLVANTLETINSAIPIYTLRRDLVLSRKEKVKVANAVAIFRLVSGEIFRSNSLNPAHILSEAKQDIARDGDLDRRLDEHLELEGIGSSTPSRGELRDLLDLRF